MNPLALLLIVVGVAQMPFALSDPAWNGLDLTGVLAAGAGIALQVAAPNTRKLRALIRRARHTIRKAHR